MALPLANVSGSSQAAGSRQPIHVMPVGPGGEYDAGYGSADDYWSAHHLPAANTQATITKATAGAGIRNVCRSLTVILAAGATAPTAVNLSVALIDGASGGTTYLWRATISIPAVAGAVNGIAIPVWKPGTANTAMTLEFSAAGGANTIESVSMDGTTISDD